MRSQPRTRTDPVHDLDRAHRWDAWRRAGHCSALPVWAERHDAYVPATSTFRAAQLGKPLEAVQGNAQPFPRHLGLEAAPVAFAARRSAQVMLPRGRILDAVARDASPHPMQ